MAEVYRRVQGVGAGMEVQEALANQIEVQAWLADYAFEAKAKGDALLVQAHLDNDAAQGDGDDGHAEILVEHGDVDWYVTLSDERGEKAALSIEYGRAAGYYEIEDQRGNVRKVEYGAMEGTFILHRATNLPRKQGAAKPVRTKPKRIKVDYRKRQAARRTGGSD
ncbi:hypothetical protein O7614_26685 [Micromonospora sp. WMMD961]|uniref:hypothetical protein n=1 Tax=Micromonospora sp. WMMD961 TaxID=3016100 RepID=UPI0024169DA1|nr:hypothetical protein [Micromonospora sp. WMMD961]MDG4783252.1 hypothetical protein [Micromonospora sp. WMMD961]